MFCTLVELETQVLHITWLKVARRTRFQCIRLEKSIHDGASHPAAEVGLGPMSPRRCVAFKTEANPNKRVSYLNVGCNYDLFTIIMLYVSFLFTFFRPWNQLLTPTFVLGLLQTNNVLEIIVSCIEQTRF